MSKHLQERPGPRIEESPRSEAQANDIPASPIERPLNVWLRRPSSDSAALAIIGGAVVAAFLLVALVIALIGPGLPARSTTSNTASSQTTAKIAAKNVPAHKPFDPHAPATPSGAVVNVTLVAMQRLISITPDVGYQAWTFNGTVPGPVIRVRQGQTIRFTLQNDDTKMAHSIDFHAAQTPPNVNYKTVLPGQSLTFEWHANYPGVFMYHCGTSPVMEHMANGMYGAIIVDPASGWAPAREYVLVQSEFY